MTFSKNIIHSLPWRVVYATRQGWHSQSQPRILDATGQTVVAMPQNAGHPELYDAQADLTAQTIVACVNEVSGKERCPECGYTRIDCRIHGDHNLCDNYPFFDEEKT